MVWVPVLLSCLALLLGAISFVWNWRHSESLFRRHEYPAVAWRSPEVSREGDSTVVKTSIWNNGPRDIGSIYLTAFLRRGLLSRAWCKSERIERIPEKEVLDFIVTKELEEDICDRFGGLIYDNGWRFKEGPRQYQIAFCLEYLPFIADVPYFTRRAYYLLTPIITDGAITSWELAALSRWWGWLRQILGTR